MSSVEQNRTDDKNEQETSDDERMMLDDPFEPRADAPCCLGPCWITLFFIGGTAIVSSIVGMVFAMHQARQNNRHGALFIQNDNHNTTNNVTATNDNLYQPPDPNRLYKFQMALGVSPDDESPQDKALQWLAFDDNLYDVVYEDIGDIPVEDLKQRYALVVFHVATGRWDQKGGWATMSGAYQHECLWFGVRCDRDDIRIQELDLEDWEVGNLTGTIPSEIGLLKNLTRLSIKDNSLIGEIPTEVYSLPLLYELTFSNTMMKSTLSPLVSNLSNLVSLEVSRAPNLKGTIPTELGLVSNLRRIYLFENMLNGTIPTELGRLSLLQEARFDDTQLQGTMPSQVCDLVQKSLVDLRADCELCKDPCCTPCF